MAEYVWIGPTWICLTMSKFTVTKWILNVSHILHSTRLVYKLMSTYWEMGVFRTLSSLNFESYTRFSYFRKYGRVLDMRGAASMKGFWVFQDCWYARVLNFQGYTWFSYFRKYDRVLKMRHGAIAEGYSIFWDFKYARFLCMQVLHKVLNMPE